MLCLSRFAAKQFVHKFGAKAVLEGPQVLKCFVYRGLQGLKDSEKLNANWITAAKKTMYRPMHVISSSLSIYLLTVASSP